MSDRSMHETQNRTKRVFMSDLLGVRIQLTEVFKRIPTER